MNLRGHRNSVVLRAVLAVADLPEAPTAEGRAIDISNARLNRKDRQERKDIAMVLLRIANKGIFFALLAILAVHPGRVGDLTADG